MLKKAMSSLLACFVVMLLAHGVYAANDLQDGQYTIDVNMLKPEKDEGSRMNDYVEKKALLNVVNGNKSVQITLKDSTSITGFKVEKNGTLTDPKVVQSNAQANTRTVEFSVDSFDKPINAWVSVYISIPGFHYDHEYDLRISFDKNSIQEMQVKVPEVTVPQVTAPTEKTKNNIVLYLNSKKALSNYQSITLQEAPYTKNERTLVPLRFISENIGANVQWDAKARTVTVSEQGKKIVLKEGSRQVTVNGQNQTIEVSLEIKEGVTFVPLRFISEQLGAEVVWNVKDRSISIVR